MVHERTMSLTAWVFACAFPEQTVDSLFPFPDERLDSTEDDALHCFRAHHFSTLFSSASEKLLQQVQYCMAGIPMTSKHLCAGVCTSLVRVYTSALDAKADPVMLWCVLCVVQYVELEGKKLCIMIGKSVTTPNWLKVLPLYPVYCSRYMCNT